MIGTCGSIFETGAITCRTGPALRSLDELAFTVVRLTLGLFRGCLERR